MMRRTPLKPGGPLERRTPLRAFVGLVRRSSLGVKSAPRQKAMRSAVPRDVRVALQARSRGICELGMRDVCAYHATDTSHRVTRGMGGRHGAARRDSDRLSNVMDACRLCHEWVGRFPRAARLVGWVLLRREDPAQHPVVYRGKPVFLTDDGRVVPYAEVGA